MCEKKINTLKLTGSKESYDLNSGCFQISCKVRTKAAKCEASLMRAAVKIGHQRSIEGNQSGSHGER